MPGQTPSARQSAPVPAASPVQPILGQVGRETAQRVGLLGLTRVVVDVEELDAPEAEQLRAVRITLAVGERVVLAVHRHPFLSALARGEPQEHATEQLSGRMEYERPMRQSSMEVNRGDQHGHLGQDDGNEDDQYDVQGTDNSTTRGWLGDILAGSA